MAERIQAMLAEEAEVKDKQDVMLLSLAWNFSFEHTSSKVARFEE